MTERCAVCNGVSVVMVHTSTGVVLCPDCYQKAE